MTRQPSISCSKYYSFSVISCKNRFNLFLYFFYKFTKIKIKNFECPNSVKIIKKHCMEHQTLGRRIICPCEPAYYIVDCWIYLYTCCLSNNMISLKCSQVHLDNKSWFAPRDWHHISLCCLLLHRYGRWGRKSGQKNLS